MLQSAEEKMNCEISMNDAHNDESNRDTSSGPSPIEACT